MFEGGGYVRKIYSMELFIMREENFHEGGA